MTAGELVAVLQGRQWVVRTLEGATIGWISPAAAVWSVSTFYATGLGSEGRYFTARAALEALAASDRQIV